MPSGETRYSSLGDKLFLLIKARYESSLSLAMAAFSYAFSVASNCCSYTFWITPGLNVIKPFLSFVY